MQRSIKKDQIALALFDLMEEMPYSSINVTALSRKAGCNRSTFYRSFDSKDAVLRYRILMVLDEYLGRFAGEKKKNLEGYLRNVFLSIGENSHVFKLVERDGLHDRMVDAVEDFFDNEYDLQDLPVEDQYALAFHIGGISNHIRFWVRRGCKETADEMAAIVAKGYPKGFAPLRLRLMALSQSEGSPKSSGARSRPEGSHESHETPLQ